MRRREVMALIGAAAVCSPVSVRGQETGRIYRLGSLHRGPWEAPAHKAFRDEVGRLGFVEGWNPIIDRQGYGLRAELFPAHVTKLVESNVDVIFCGAGDAAIRAAQQATATIPLLGFTDDMVASGLVQSLARPGGNTTGVSILASELDGKRLQLLLELIPGARHIAALSDTATTGPRQLEALKDLALGRGVEPTVHPVAKPEEVVPAIEAAKTAGAAGLTAQWTDACGGWEAVAPRTARSARSRRPAAPPRPGRSPW